MGRRGTTPKPAELLRMHGTFRADRHAERDDAPAVIGLPQRPEGMRGEAGWLWDLVVPELAAAGVLKRVDTPILMALCDTWAKYREMSQLSDMDSLDKGMASSARQWLHEWAGLAAKCGLTPGDRTNIRVEAAKTSASKRSYFA